MAGTGQLPDVEFSNDLPSAVGQSTIKAIQAGVDLGIIGAVDRILKESKRILDKAEITTIAVGGDRHYFTQNIDGLALGPENFTLKGLAAVAEQLL